MAETVPFVEPTEKQIKKYILQCKIYLFIGIIAVILIGVGSFFLGKYLIGVYEENNPFNLLLGFLLMVIVPILICCVTYLELKDIRQYTFNDAEKRHLVILLTKRKYQKEKFWFVIKSKIFWSIQCVNIVALGKEGIYLIGKCIVYLLGYCLVAGMLVSVSTELGIQVTEEQLSTSIQMIGNILISLIFLIVAIAVVIKISIRSFTIDQLIKKSVAQILALLGMMRLPFIKNLGAFLNHQVSVFLIVFGISFLLIYLLNYFVMKKVKLLFLGSKERELSISRAVSNNQPLSECRVEKSDYYEAVLPVKEWQPFISVKEVHVTQDFYEMGMGLSEDGLIINDKRCPVSGKVIYKVNYSWLLFTIEQRIPARIESSAQQAILVEKQDNN